MNLEANFVCSNCEISKKAYNDQLLQLRTSFVEYKKRVICTDKLFKQLTAKRSQIAKVEGKLQEANNNFFQAQEQFKSTLINHKLSDEKCKSLELQLANVTAERDKELCDFLTIQQQKAALDEKLKITNQRLQNVQMASAEKIKKLEAKNNGGDKKALEKLNEKFVAQGIELTVLKQELDNQEADCVMLKKELEDCRIDVDNSSKDKLTRQEKELSCLQEELREKHRETKILKETLTKANEANRQVESLVDKLESQETECSLLRDMVTSQREEMELLRQAAAVASEEEKLRTELKAQENEVILLRQKLKEQNEIINTAKKEGDTSIGSVVQVENLSEQDCQRAMLNTELQNLREQIETMKFKFDENDTEQLKTELAEKNSEMVSLKNEMEMQKRDLEDARQKLEANEKDILLREGRFSENGDSTPFNDKEISQAEEIAVLKLQLLTLQSEANFREENVEQITEGPSTTCNSEHNAVEVFTMDASRQSDEEITALKLQISALQTEVDLKTKEIEKLNVPNKLQCNSDLSSESNNVPVATAGDKAMYDAMKSQLANLQTEVDLKGKEIEQMKEKEIKNIRSYKDLKEKERLAEERAFELVADLAQLKAKNKETNSVSLKCIELEKTLALRDSQINQLRTELKGFLSCERRDPRKPSGTGSSSSGRGSCATSDLEDSAMLVDQDMDLDVAKILRSMAAVPALLSPIDGVEQPVPPVLVACPPRPPSPPAARPYHQPPERSTQEKMLLALVESVRSATESYEKLYGTTIAAPILPRPPPEACVGRAKPVGNAVVAEWIKNVRPEIGADQRSFSDGFGSANSSKGSVGSQGGRKGLSEEVIVIQEVSVAQKSVSQKSVSQKSVSQKSVSQKSVPQKSAPQRSVPPDTEIRPCDGSRDMSSAFSGRRVLGGAGITKLPSEVVALSRRLRSVTVKKSLYESDLDRVRNSVALANKADLFVVNKAPTMTSLCASLNVEVPSKFAGSAVEGSSANKRTTRSQVLNKTNGPSAISDVTAWKNPAKRKIPPISESFVRSSLRPKCNPPNDLNCAKNSPCGTNNTVRANKTVHSASSTSATTVRPEVVVPMSKKKRKAMIDVLFGSDDDQLSPAKKQCTDETSTVCSDDEISIVSVLSSESVTLQGKNKLPCNSLLSETEKQSCELSAAATISLIKGSNPKSPLVPKIITPSDTNTILLEVPSSNNSIVQEATEESLPTTGELVPKFAAPDSENVCEVPLPNPEDGNFKEEMMPSNPRVEDQDLGSAKLDPTAKNSTNEIKTDEPQVEADNKSCKMETTDKKDEDGCNGLSKDSSCVLDSRNADSTPTLDASDHTSAADAVDSKEMKSIPAQHLEDDALSDCELVIADPLDEPLQISSDDDDSSDDYITVPRLSVSVQTEPTVKDESSKYDSDDEPLSSLLSSRSKASSPAYLQKSPSKLTAATMNTSPVTSELPICVSPPPPKSEVNRPFFYKTQEEEEQAVLSRPVEIEEPAVPLPPPPPPPPPPKILRDETGVWNKRIYVSLAYNDAFNIHQGDLEEKLPPKERVMGRYLRIVFRKYLTSRAPPEDALAMTVNNVLDITGPCLVKEVITEVINDKGEIEKNKSDELETTDRVRKLISLIVALHELNPTLTDEVLTKVEGKLCNLSTKPLPNLMHRFISLHLGICLRLQLSERQRTFLYDVLYCYSGKAMIPICQFILSVAPFSLKHGFMGQDDIVSLTVAYSLQFGRNEWLHDEKDLGNLVSQRYKYSGKRMPSASQLVDRILCLLKDGNLDFVEASLVLLSKRLGWSCASSKIVSPLLAIVDQWKCGTMPLRCAVVSLRVLAYFVRIIPKSECEVADTLFVRISNLLQSGKPEIYEPVLEVLMLMGKEKHYSTVVNLLLSHGETSSEEFTASATAYITKVSSMSKRVRKPYKRAVCQNVGNDDQAETDDEEKHSAKVDTKKKAIEKEKLEKKAAKNKAKKQRQFLNKIRQVSMDCE